MPTCKLCDKWGLFLKLGENGLCSPCYVQFGMDLESGNRIMNESMNLIDNSKNPKTRLSRCDDFIRHASILARYECKGIVTTNPPPSELLRRGMARKAEILKEYEVPIACPYCNVVLNQPPKRRKACPSCRRPILVRKGKLCTEEEARALDCCERLGIEQSELHRIQEKLSSEFGRSASYSDAVWRLMNRILVKTQDWQQRKGIYCQMSRFLWEEKKDNLQVGQEAVRVELARYKEDEKAGVFDLKEWRIEIITCKEASCSACRPLEGRILTFEEFAETMPLPIPDCTHGKTTDNPRGWCRCVWGLVRSNPQG